MTEPQITAKLIEEISPIKKKIEVEAPKPWIAEELDKAYKEIQKKAKIKGFRPGKAPREILEKFYEPEAHDRAVRQLVQRAYPEAVKELKLIPVAYPQITVKKFSPDGDMSFEATVETKPEVGEVKGYKEIKLIKDKIKVTDEEIEKRLRILQEGMAKLVPLEAARLPQKGDVVFIDYEALVGGASFKGNKVNNYQVEIGSGRLLPGFEEEILQMKKGESRKIEQTLPGDYSDKKFAGKCMTYNVVLQDIKAKIIPEADDELAKSLGEFQTVKEVRDKIREEMHKSKEVVEKGKLKKQVIERLIKKNKLEIPEGMIQSELESMLHNFSSHLQSQGVSLEQAGINQEEFYKKNREEAIARLQGLLFFEAIARMEGIDVSQEELDKKLEDMARMSRQPVANIKKYYNEHNMTPYLRSIISEEKTLDFVLINAKIKEK
ncbi:MAG: trigger factor [Deltaproteobacteria bacterium RIFCSPLOWO2_02_FULL_50_16]|nr:MAG: trigger factor [Deltaproteobacteria bacterium GWA2_50_8]OGQ26881.1 MAG: trigger factor [Deltaproteobacteria bacterium RIFCSPHIGHO2_02_FULL_50_15]OGQ57999.1 MAG: trigger factor [Deltaproteobacteria bacterium RIFCSPLOWO2_02_FULL_50_16]OGQ68092.1 MAG: trigger factor [Deltaproteobacteria bacterium RIFCSPLOWO2_12_FULL_50_11]